MIAAAAVWLTIFVGPFNTYEECERAKEIVDPIIVEMIKYQCNGIEESAAPTESPLPVPKPRRLW
jgi:hypothetical protein